jgi:hypothetical protein
MEHGLGPSFVEILYHSAYAQHKQTIPTRDWNSAAGGGPDGGFTAWDASTIGAEDMITALVALATSLFPVTVNFDSWVVKSNVGVDSSFVPVAAGAFTDQVGTVIDHGWDVATQFVWTFYDTAFNTAKLTLLDVASLDNFNRRASSTQSVYEAAYSAELMAMTNAWSSRAGFRPASVRSMSCGINDELKKQYSVI